MIRHIVLLKFKPEATQGQKEAVLEGMNQLPKGIAEIRAFSSGLKVRGTHDVGIVVDFDSIEGLDAYIPHPVHQALVAKLREMGVADMSSIASFDFEV